MNYNYVIGFLLSTMFVTQFISGLLLSCYYSDHWRVAFESVVYVMTDVKVGWLIRVFHMVGVSLFILFVYSHLARGIWIRLRSIYLDSAMSVVWASGILILAVSLAEGFLGYILLWGQMSYWGITVILNIVSIFPHFGPAIVEWVWASSQVVVYRVFVLHYLLGVLVGLLIVCHIFILHSFTNSNPLVNANSSIIVPFYPLLYKDAFIMFSLAASSLSIVLYLEPDILGNHDNLIPANPLQTPNNILPEWYYLCFYCCLRCFPDKTIGFVMVLTFLLFLNSFTYLPPH